jgi:hypothetical protein
MGVVIPATSQSGANGGSGVVILQVLLNITARSTTGTPTITTDGTHRYYTFTGTGTIMF